MAKLYRRIGIRRDNNFSDLENRTEALNNLLDKLGTDIPGGTFISPDLDAIRGLFSTGLSASEYQQFGGSTVKETDINGNNAPVSPAITYQNRLDSFKIDSGESPRLNGGNGLTANYFNQDQVKFDTVTDVFVGVTTGPAIPSDNFWEAGNFVYSRKITARSVDAAGGVQWDGFFVPTQTGQYTFNISSTLGFTAEFEKEGYTTGISTFNSIARVGLTTTIITAGSNSVSADAANDKVVITGSTATGQKPNIGVGMTVISSNPSGRVVLGSKVSGVSTTTTGDTEITFNTDDIPDPVVSDGTVAVGLARPAGTSASNNYVTYTLEKFRRYKVRFRFFVPETLDTDDLRGIVKSITFTYNPPGSASGIFLRYNNLYTLDYDFSDDKKGTFNRFLDQSVLFGGNKTDSTETIGSTSIADGYVRVSTNKKVDIKYIPKTALTQIERASYTTSWTAGSKIISLSNTTGIEIGNYVFSATQGLTANVNTPVRVTDVVINDFIVIDAPATNTRSSIALTFVNHRGFVKRVTASASGGNITIGTADNTAGLKSNQLAIWNGSNSYSGITTSGATNNVTVFPAQGFGTQRVYFYESKGLIDTALATFCVPAETQCFLVTSNVAADNNVLPTTSTANIQVGYTIQGFSFASGTTVTSKTINSLTLSTPTIKNIAADSNFTATSSSQDKSLCCPPTDTSPPFEPTEAGLETTVSEPNVKFNGGNLKFDALLATMPTSNITAVTQGTSLPSSNNITIQGGDGVSYDLFCV